jgi:hypothetical protein
MSSMRDGFSRRRRVLRSGLITYSIIDFRITPAGHSYFYGYTRLLSQLFLVRGLT